jgi:hypothetical protein
MAAHPLAPHSFANSVVAVEILARGVCSACSGSGVATPPSTRPCNLCGGKGRLEGTLSLRDFADLVLAEAIAHAAAEDSAPDAKTLDTPLLTRRQVLDEIRDQLTQSLDANEPAAQSRQRVQNAVTLIHFYLEMFPC